MNRLPYPWLKQTYKKEEEEKMKKLISILAIMIVLVGAVFATDSAQLTLNVSVPERVPTFKLLAKVNTGETAVLTAAGEAAVANPAGTASVSTTEAISEQLAEGTAATVTFGVVQVPAANGKKIKTTNSYTFTVAATNLINSTDNNYYFERGTISNFSVDTAIANTDAVVNVSTPGQVTITYSGKSYDPGADISFAKFTIVYNGNASAIPGTYTGTVTLTMQTNN